MVAHLIQFATDHYALLAVDQCGQLAGAEAAAAAGHIVGALNIPQDKLMARVGELEKHKAKTLILVDAQGQHSGIHARELLKAGFTAAKLSGGIGSWKADNLPLVK